MMCSVVFLRWLLRGFIGLHFVSRLVGARDRPFVATSFFFRRQFLSPRAAPARRSRLLLSKHHRRSERHSILPKQRTRQTGETVRTCIRVHAVCGCRSASMPGWTGPTMPGAPSASRACCRQCPGTAPPPRPPTPPTAAWATTASTGWSRTRPAAWLQPSSATKPCEIKTSIELLGGGSMYTYSNRIIIVDFSALYPWRYAGSCPLCLACTGVWSDGVRHIERAFLRIRREIRNPGAYNFTYLHFIFFLYIVVI